MAAGSWSEMRSERQAWWQCAGCIFTTFMLVAAVVLGLGIGTVQYTEYAFIRSRTTGKIDRSTVYLPGRYWLGVDGYFVTYPSKAQTVLLKGLNVFSRAVNQDDAGTELNLDLSFQYLLKPDELEELYSKTAFNYQSYINNLVTNAVKNNATDWSSDDFLTNRRRVESSFYGAVQSTLAEDANAQLLSVQLRHVQFPEAFYSRKLSAAIQVQEGLKESFQRSAAEVRGLTKEQVKYIENDADEILGRADAQASLIRKKAENQRALLQGLPRVEGLNQMKVDLGLSDEEVNSLDYLINLATDNVGGRKLVVNYNDLTEAKSFT